MIIEGIEKLNRIICRGVEWQVNRIRKISDKAVSKVLIENEKIHWSGMPGFVATFNSREVVFSAIATTVIAIVVAVIMGTPPETYLPLSDTAHTTAHIPAGLPFEFYALLTVTVCGIALLFIGWVRQICRYITTLGMYYAVTPSRLVVIKHGKIVREMPVQSVKSTAIKKKLFGNGSIVFNEGEEYFKEHMLESPPAIKKGIFAFFNVLDPDNALTILTNLKGIQNR